METDRVPPYSMQYLQQFDPNPWNENKIDNRNGIGTSIATKVHVNPNFKNGKSLSIHVNPRMHQNRKIHVNPKMMKNMVPAVETEAKIDLPRDNGRLPCSSRLCPVEAPTIQKSIHVNPKLMKELSSIARESIEVMKSKTAATNFDKACPSIPSKTNENFDQSHKIAIKTSSPRLLSLSRRKLVRISPSVKATVPILTPSSLKRLNRKSLPVVQANPKKSPSSQSLTKFTTLKNKYKLNAYKIDRTIKERKKPKKICILDARVRNVNKGLVAIGGVMYQSSRTQLVRSGTTSSSVHKKKNCVASAKDNTFVMAKNGKKLHRLHTGKEGSNVTRYMISRNSFNQTPVLKKVPNSIVQSSHKNVISYKAKQRSLQILRDKLRKNYIPCLLYRRFGYCTKHAKGTCPKLHDKKQVALCKNFLQGKCLLDGCSLSHDIGPEKMPTCKYFLEGCCIRDACPYLHVKVSANTPLCPQFLRGYCAEGNKCKQRHAYICPDFEKLGKCAKGKYCPYPHKLKSAAALVSKRSAKNVRRGSSSKRIPANPPSKNIEKSDDGRKRYYDNASPSDEQLAILRENILKRMKCMKTRLGVSESSDDNSKGDSSEITIDEDAPESDGIFDERPKRAPIGPLPAYIPIN